MSIIKCPECGHQTSDKAPVCPNCGVEISGKIIKCQYCGEIYLKSEVVCPHCHHSEANNVVAESDDNAHLADLQDNMNNDNTLSTETYSDATDVQNVRHDDDNDNGEDNNTRRSKKSIVIISIIVALVVFGICYYVYNKDQADKENEEYVFALNSEDPLILKEYLNNFKDAPQEHIDSINSRLNRLEQLDQDWTNALISGSKSAMVEFLKSHPDSKHKQEALDKIDSLDWAQCANLNTIDAYQSYIDNHSDGNYYEEALVAMKKIKANVVSNEERKNIGDLFHKFFVCINDKDEYGIVTTVSDYVNFLGKSNATKEDIVFFMNRLYKPDIKKMTWSISGDYNIVKKEIGDEQYEYIVNFMTGQTVEKTDNTNSDSKYKIAARVNPDMKITEMSMTKINE